MNLDLFKYINMIYELNNPTFKTLTNRMGLSKPAVTAIVNTLIKNNIAYKSQSIDDIRVYFINLTNNFNIYCGNVIESENQDGIEKLGRYIIRAPISQERMKYISSNKSHDSIAKVIYKSKTTGKSKTFDVLEWCAKVVSHIPNKDEQLVRYYGFYSNKSRGQRKKANTDNKIPSLVNTDISKKHFKKNWARLIQKIYNVDPLECKKCGGQMRIISFIEEEAVIKKILLHLGLWYKDLKKNHDPPKNIAIKNIPDSQKSYAFCVG